MTDLRQLVGEIDLSVVDALDFGAFDENDLLNLVLQRSGVLFDIPRSGRLIREWSAGNAAPLEAVVQKLGVEIARRAAAIIYAEFLGIKPVLDRLDTGFVADIGCGYAMFDLFLGRAFGARILLVDIEENDARHFGFAGSGAAYASLDVARRFLQDNGLAGDRIKTVNPLKEDLGRFNGITLATSFLSCGFHYPVSTYTGFFRNQLCDDGAIILDRRKRDRGAQLADLRALGNIEVLKDGDNFERILVKKRKQK